MAIHMKAGAWNDCRLQSWILLDTALLSNACMMHIIDNPMQSPKHQEQYGAVTTGYAKDPGLT